MSGITRTLQDGGVMTRKGATMLCVAPELCHSQGRGHCVERWGIVQRGPCLGVWELLVGVEWLLGYTAHVVHLHTSHIQVCLLDSSLP